MIQFSTQIHLPPNFIPKRIAEREERDPLNVAMEVLDLLQTSNYSPSFIKMVLEFALIRVRDIESKMPLGHQ